MEGHPGYEHRSATPARGRRDASDATRKRAFLVLEGERRWLAAHLRPPWRPRGRYEDLSLVIMLARLERDWLSRPPRLVGGEGHSADRHQPGNRLAGWAMPWGAAPRTKLEADIDHLGDTQAKLGRWLPRRTVAVAEGTARLRLAVITAGLQEPGPRAWTAVPAAAPGPARTTPRFELPVRMWVTAAAALLLLGAGGFLIAGSEQSSRPGSVGRPDAGAGMGGNQQATNIQTHGGSTQGRRVPDRPGNTTARSNTGAGSDGAGSTPVASDAVPAPPEAPPVAEAVAPPQPAPAPEPASPPSPSSQAKDAGGCPPEFGYEC